MRDQLVHLAAMARCPNITVQVIPSVSMHAGLMGAFALAETPELPNIVYLENADDGQTIEDPQMGSKMALQFDALRTEALTGRASIATIEKAADQWKEE
jgi:Domain of unknown function (DUF5753)